MSSNLHRAILGLAAIVWIALPAADAMGVSQGGLEARPVMRVFMVMGSRYSGKAFRAKRAIVPETLSYDHTSYVPVGLMADMVHAVFDRRVATLEVRLGERPRQRSLLDRAFPRSVPVAALPLAVTVDGRSVAAAGTKVAFGGRRLPPVLSYRSTLYVPVAWIAEMLSFHRTWSPATKTMTLTPRREISLTSPTLEAGGTLSAQIPEVGGLVTWLLKNPGGESFPIFGATSFRVNTVLPRDIPAGRYTLVARSMRTGTTTGHSVTVTSTWSDPLAADGRPAIDPFQAMNHYDLIPLYAQGLFGQGETIGIFAESDVRLSDLGAFDRALGLPPPRLTYPEGDPGTNRQGLGEAELDVEWAHALAPDATIALYIASPGKASPSSIASDLLDAASRGDRAFSVSFTYPGDGTAAEDKELTQAVSSGLAVFAATGDSGNHGGASPYLAWPATSPYAVAVGGTEISDGTDSYWNSSTGPLAQAGGYGISDYASPAWQEAVTGSSMRQVPDVSFLARDALDETQGAFTEVDGTSLAAPAWAALWALLTEGAGRLAGVAPQILYGAATSKAVDATPGFLEQTPGSPDTVNPRIGLGVPNAANLLSDLQALSTARRGFGLLNGRGVGGK